MLDAEGEVGIVEPHDHAQVVAHGAGVQRRRQVHQVVAGGRHDRSGGADVELLEDLRMAGVADQDGIPAARAGDDEPAIVADLHGHDGDAAAAIPSATR